MIGKFFTAIASLATAFKADRSFQDSCIHYAASNKALPRKKRVLGSIMTEPFQNDSLDLQRLIRSKNYKAFLCSPRWSDLRIACFAHYFPEGKTPKCWACGRLGRVFVDNPTTLNKTKLTLLHVHHLSYPALDPANDLVPVCGRCNGLAEKFRLPRGLSPQEFQQRMQNGFNHRARIKRILAQFDQSRRDAVELVRLTKRELAWVKEGKRLYGRQIFKTSTLEDKVPGYVRWLKRERLKNTEDAATRFLLEVDFDDENDRLWPLLIKVGYDYLNFDFAAVDLDKLFADVKCLRHDLLADSQ